MKNQQPDMTSCSCGHTVAMHTNDGCQDTVRAVSSEKQCPCRCNKDDAVRNAIVSDIAQRG